MNDRELDAEFERIIAGWDDEATDPQSLRDDRPEAPAATAPSDRPIDGEPVQSAPEESAEATEGTTGGTTDATATGLNISIAPLTPHVWRGAPTPADDVDEVLEQADPEDEHFEPPTMTDLPKAEDDPMFWAIVGGLGGGPLLLLYLLLFDRDGSGWWVATALAMTVVGFVLLVLRGGNERDPFDDGTRV